jgi:sugar O-acyltransferase (sialic acid O-acetyltransferase NeuD family)
MVKITKNFYNQIDELSKKVIGRKRNFVVIWGMGDHYQSLLSIIQDSGYNILCFIDEHKQKSDFDSSIPYFSSFEGLKESGLIAKNKNISAVVALSNKFKDFRVINYEKLLLYGINPLSLLDSTALIRRDVLIGKGVQIMSNVFVNSKTDIGDYCIINSSAILEHHCSLDVGVEVGPGAILLGRVRIEEFVQIGAGAVVLPGVTVGAHSLIGAGSIVTKDIPKKCIAVGNPARITKRI